MTETRQSRRVNSARYGASNNRSTWGYWVPLAITVTAATAGLVAYVWNSRKEEEDDSSADEHYSGGGRPPPGGGYASMSGGLGPGQGPGPGPGPYVDQPPPPGGYEGGPPPQPPWGPANRSVDRSIGAQSTGVEQTRNVEQTRTEDTGLVARMSNALGIGRSASPSKAYDWASRNVTAGMAAVGAAVGGALGYSEETKHQYEDHNRWSEEAERKESESASRGLQRQGTAHEFYSGSVEMPRSTSMSNNRKRKTVAIVVSSVQDHHDDDVGSHASILAALPSHVDHTTTRIFVLIYAPDLTAHPLSPAATRNQNGSNAGSVSGTRPISRTSSYSHIATDEGRTPGEFPGEKSLDGGILANVDPQPIDESTTPLYKTLHNQAMALVDRDTMIIPFTSPQGHKHIIKSLSPEIMYIQESLCGGEGEVVAELSSRWVRTTIVVIGDEGGRGGLVDTDTEDESARKGSSTYGQKWWKREERTGVGRGVSVVEALRVGEDWRRRVGGED